MGRIIRTSSPQFCYVDGTLIDFNKIVGIEEPQFIDMMGSGGYFCSYSLLTISGERIVFERELTDNEVVYKRGRGFELCRVPHGRDFACEVNEKNHCNELSMLWMKSQKNT
tara:strand:+ start:1380 stop:1712 length:333 start_codon:yes stop_codon:yes gene_type:complete